MTKTLLIVDDEPAIRAELAEYFAAKGYRVERAPAAAEGQACRQQIELTASAVVGPVGKW